MNTKPSVELESRDARRWLADILARRPGFTPEWLAPDKSAGAALARICARYLEAVGQRLDQAPGRNKLAFLDLAGLQLIAAQQARAPVVFQLAEGGTGGGAPARTPVAAPPPPGQTDQIAFETERAVGVTAGKIAQVVSLWPGRDEWVDHTAAFLGGQPIQPFAAALRQPTPHHLYLAHAVLLALAGNVELEVEFEVAHPAGGRLEIVWEYWDGQVWRGFRSTSPECEAPTAKDVDSTDGLTQSGHYVLSADGAQAAKTTVAGVESWWLRGRLTQPLPPDPGFALPEVDSVRIASTVNRALRGRLKVSEPYAPPVATMAHTVFEAAAPPSVSVLTGLVANEAGHPVKGALVRLFDPATPGAPAFTSTATDEHGRYQILNVNFARDYLYDVVFAGVRFTGPEATLRPKEQASAAKPAVDLTLLVEGLDPDKAFADGAALDVSKPFYPLGQQPQPGSAFYFTSEEAFTKPGATVRIYLARTRSPQDEGAISGTPSTLEHHIAWEYWNGRQWAPLAVTSTAADSLLDLARTEVVELTVPIDMTPVTVNGQEARWARVRLLSGTYGFRQEVTFKTGDTGPSSTFAYVVVQPPVLAAFRLGYAWQHGPFPPEQVTTYNDFRYRDETEAAVWPGPTFRPFDRVADVTPVLYLGFDKQPPADQLGLHFEVKEAPGEPAGPALTWEYWDGFEWRRMPAEDETGSLRRPGIVTVLAQPDDAALDRFGRALHWVRSRLKEDGPPGEPVFRGIFPNAVWASERRTLRDLPIGASSGTPDQAFVITHVPVLAGEQLEVRELSGPRANVEWRILAMELFDGDEGAVAELDAELGREGLATAVVRGPLRLTRDRRKQVSEVWVRWESREQLFFSGPDDRHYAIDRAVGRLYFGDGVNGRVPPPGAAVAMREMTTGGGSRGNVAARTITQLLGVVPGIQAVFNPRAAEGGADGETPIAALDRGPRTIRHRGRALLAADYETLAAEASPAVAIVRAIAGRDPAGLTRPGWITLLIVPRSRDRRPYPSFGLREHVRRFVEGRAPADVAAGHRIHVTGPTYLAIDVAATVAPVNASEAGAVEARVREALERFLHPLSGGPGGQGWDLGRDVFLSDVAAEVERVDGVDYVEELTLLLGGVPQGESVAVGDAEIVAAGAITLKLIESER